MTSTTHRLCKLPHSVGDTSFEKSSATTIFQPMLCPAHLQYMYGISEGDVRMQPTDFTKQITNEYMYSGRRGYTLFARQSWRSADECDTLVFCKGDIIFPTAKYMSSIVEQLNNETEAVRLLTKSDTAGVCSRPITKFLRKLMFRRRIEPSELLQTSVNGEISSSFSQLETNVGDEARDEIVTNLHLFYYAHAFYPLKNAFDSQTEPPEMAKQYYYFRTLWRDLKLSYEIAESVRDLFAEMYAQMIPESEKYSGQFWRTLKGIDVPVGRDIDRDARPKCVGENKQQRQESSCPEAAKVFANVDKNLWQARVFSASLPRPFYFTHSISIPNCEFIEEKGFVATRDIYHDEELTLEPFADKAQHVPLSYWSMLNMLRKKPSEECDSNRNDIRPPREPQQIQQPYSEKIHVRGRCLTQLIM